MLVSVPSSSVKYLLPVLVLPVPSFTSILQTGSLQASPSENIVFSKENLYTATYHYNKKENLSL